MTKLISSFAAAAAFAVGTLAIASPAFADDAPATPAAPPPDVTITGAASLVTQYRFRGLSQSNNQPVVQATATITHKSGFYVAFWGSSASSNSFINSPIDIGGTEIDAWGGWSHTYKGYTVDGGIYGYIYPGSASTNRSAGVNQNSNYYELYGDVSKSYGPVTAKVGLNFAPAQSVFNLNFTSKHRVNAYVFGELSYSPPKTPITLHSHLGHTGGGFDYAKQYIDYTVGASYKYKALTFDISLVGTNISNQDTIKAFGCGTSVTCASYYHRPAKTAGVGTITASF